MRKYLLVILFCIPTLAFAFSEEAPPGMAAFNVTCPAKELCPLLDKAFETCRNTKNAEVCSIYIQILRKLAPNYDCQRAFDNTPEKKFIVPAYWLCEPTKAWAYIELLSKL